MNAKKDPLEVVIEKLNETYNGSFTNAEELMLELLYEKLCVRKAAKADRQQIFEEDCFPKVVGQT